MRNLPKAGRWIASVATALIALSACAGAPVQEMSDARQAIAAARAAGAAERAGIELDVATDLLTKAEAALQRGDYGAARRQAEQARPHALEAQKLASTATES